MQDTYNHGPYLIRYCATPGCGVRIRELVQAQGAKTCKWCQSGATYAQQKQEAKTA